MSVASGLSQRNKRPRDQIDRHNVERRGREGGSGGGGGAVGFGREKRERGVEWVLLISRLALQVMQATVGNIMKCKRTSATLEGFHRVGQTEVSMTTSIVSAPSGPPGRADYSCISLRAHPSVFCLKILCRPLTLFPPADQRRFIYHACDNFQSSFDY